MTAEIQKNAAHPLISFISSKRIELLRAFTRKNAYNDSSTKQFPNSHIDRNNIDKTFHSILNSGAWQRAPATGRSQGKLRIRNTATLNTNRAIPDTSPNVRKAVTPRISRKSVETVYKPYNNPLHVLKEGLSEHPRQKETRKVKDDTILQNRALDVVGPSLNAPIATQFGTKTIRDDISTQPR